MSNAEGSPWPWEIGVVEATSHYDEDGNTTKVTYRWVPADARTAGISREAFDMLAADAGWVQE